MEAIAILLFAAAVAHGIAHLLRVPAIPLLLVIGVALGGFYPIDDHLLEDALVLGTTLLLFVTGMELSPKRTRAQRRAAIDVGALQFAAVAIAGLGASLLLGYALLESAYLALALTASSTLVVVRLLQRRRQLFEPFGRLVLGVLLLQDVLVLVLVPLVTRLPLGALPVITGIAGTAAIAGAALLVHRYVAPLIERLDQEHEVLLLVLLGILFGFVALADMLALPLVTGAFLGGVALARFPLSGMVRTQLASIAEFFSALFFLALGALIGIPTTSELLHALVLAAVVVLITVPLVTVIAERAGMSTRAGIESALLLAQTSEISLVLGLFGYVANQISVHVFTVIALVTLITMLLTPFITTEPVLWWLARHRPIRATPQRRRIDQQIPTHDHVLVLGSGSTGMPLLETLLSSGYEVLVVDDDPIVIQRLRDAEIPCLRGDASDIALLHRAGAGRARIITSTIRRPRDNARLLEAAQGVPTLVRVFEEQDADWIRDMGGTPILASHATADEMLRWFDRTVARPASSNVQSQAQPGGAKR